MHPIILNGSLFPSLLKPRLKPRTALALLTAAGSLVCLPASAAGTTVLLDTFGPDNAHSTSGWSIAGIGHTVANPITVTGQNYTLNQIDAAFFLISGPNSVDLSLVPTGSDGFPSNAVLESFHFDNVSSLVDSPPLEAQSALHPLLSAGQTYWLVASVSSPTTQVSWLWSYGEKQGVLDFIADPNYGYSSYSSATQSAYRIYADAIPEASTTVSLGFLLALSMGGVLLSSRRKKLNT